MRVMGALVAALPAFSLGVVVGIVRTLAVALGLRLLDHAGLPRDDRWTTISSAALLHRPL
jgi:hypothetical protein